MDNIAVLKTDRPIENGRNMSIYLCPQSTNPENTEQVLLAAVGMGSTTLTDKSPNFPKVLQVSITQAGVCARNRPDQTVPGRKCL